MKARCNPLPAPAVALLAALLLAPCAAFAQDARQVMVEAQKRTMASSQHYAGTLQVFDARGKISDKRWTFDRLGSHGSSKSILRFADPPEVKGVALLVVNHPDRASDQWMWTPAIQRDRRVALQDRSQRFFGTDFSFEDLEERDVDQYDFSMDGEETLNGAPCWRIDATPRKTKVSQYSKSRVWVRKDNYAYQKVELHQVRSRPGAELQRHPERPGHLDGPDARDDRPQAKEQDGAQARGAEIQPADEGAGLHPAVAPARSMMR
jgi:hypothetical protein